jgi:hypothetical protein
VKDVPTTRVCRKSFLRGLDISHRPTRVGKVGRICVVDLRGRRQRYFYLRSSAPAKDNCVAKARFCTSDGKIYDRWRLKSALQRQPGSSWNRQVLTTPRAISAWRRGAFHFAHSLRKRQTIDPYFPNRTGINNTNIVSVFCIVKCDRSIHPQVENAECRQSRRFEWLSTGERKYVYTVQFWNTPETLGSAA